MQVIDNLLVIHDLDSRSTQVYDFKIVDYSIPLLKPNLRVDLSHSDRYISDFFLPEEIPKPEGENINALGLKNKISEDKAEPEAAVIEEEKKEVSDIDIYDDQTIFIAPMFIVHPTKFRSMSLKLSLHQYVTSCADDCNLMLSILNRNNNKEISLSLCKDLILQKRISLIGISKLFTKFNQVYKQASLERSSVRKKLTEGQATSFDNMEIFNPHDITSE